MAINEPIERSQERTGKVTAGALLAVVKQAGDSLYMHGDAVHDRPSYSDAWIFTVSAVTKIGGRTSRVEQSVKLDVPGYVSNGHTSKRETYKPNDGPAYFVYRDAFRPVKGFWSFSCYGQDGEQSGLRAILETLPRDAEVAFHVSLDAGTNQYLVDATAVGRYGAEEGLHSDRLYLVAEVKRGQKTIKRRFLVDATCGAHNSARFGVGR